MTSEKAVERAKTQLYLSLVNAGLTTVQAMQGAAASSKTFGFYGSGYVNITNSKATQTSEFSQSQASNLISKGNLSLTANQGDINITGSNVGSTNGNLDIAAMMGNLNVKAGELTSPKAICTASGPITSPQSRQPTAWQLMLVKTST